jgi:hypothetical protein
MEKEKEINDIKKFNLIFVNEDMKKRIKENKEILKNVFDLNSSKQKENNVKRVNPNLLPFFKRGNLNNSFLYNLKKNKNNTSLKLI